MQTDGSPFTAEIRQTLIKSFRDEDLTALCFDYFRDVYDTFSTGTTKDHKVQLLIEHCVRRELVSNLLAAIQRLQAEQRPARFPSARPEPAKYERDPRQVFVSHAHEDARFAHRLAEDLQKNGWRAWIAPESIRPGEKWVEAINRGLDESGVFLLVLTPKAVRSTWVMDETNVAVEYQHEGHLRFIPLEVEHCTVPPLWRAYQRTSFLGRYQDGLSSLLTELGAADRAADGKADKRRILAPPLPQQPPIDRAAGRTVDKWRLNPAKALKSLQGSRIWVGAVVLALAALVVVVVLISQSPVPLTPTPTDTPSPPTPTTESAVTPAPVVTRISEKDDMVMVYVPAGEFLMGSMDSDKDAESNEKPQHSVYLDAFWIDKTEVTNIQYDKCVQTGACKVSSYAHDPKYNGDNQPVVGVDWSQAQAYCQWVARQLPSEAQWEKAAQGTGGRIYPWGDQPATCEYAVMNDGSGNGCGRGDAAWPVGSKPKGASQYGVLDMAGNVWEWVADWYDENYYTSSPSKNPPGPSSGQDRVMRGGSWYNGKTGVRVVSRASGAPDIRYTNIGFRCVEVERQVPTDTPSPPTRQPVSTLMPPTSMMTPTSTMTPMPRSAATPTPVATRISEKDDMVYVPAGEFLMGSVGSDKDAESDEKPQHKVYLDAFWIDKTEVTNAQYKKCVQAGACTASGSASHYKYSADNQPVGDVDWNSAKAYCQWVGGQLPTEAQWEKAARGTDGQIYPWGDEPATCEYAVMDDGSGQACGKENGTWPVGSKPDGAGPYGALDMAGNVEEWVADWYDERYYTNSPFKNPPGPSSGRYRVVRSSAWHLNEAYVRAASRLYVKPDFRDMTIGFRCVRVGPGG